MPMQHIEITSPITLVTTAETVVASFHLGPQVANPPIPGSSQVSPTVISGYVNVTQGTTGTAVTVRVRHGVGTGGAVVNSADTDSLAAAGLESIYFEKTDPVGDTDYTVTVQLTGASANGSVNAASIDVDQGMTGRV